MTEQELSLIAFTDRGAELMERLRQQLGGEALCSRCQPDFSLAEWTARRFPHRQALIFVGAVGIAVRAVAPHIKSKAQDPAVVVVDEAGRFVIPLLSGHLGGANALAAEVARICGGTPVITTATDINRRFAVDLWAKRQGLCLTDTRGIKLVSGKLLAGNTVSVCSRWPVAGDPPPGVVLTDDPLADVIVDVYGSAGSGLQLVPVCCTLGVGCRRGTAAEALERAFSRFCAERDLRAESIRGAASIDLKQDETGLLEFCRSHGWEPAFFTAAELAAVPGSFTPSAFVAQTVGVDNVCERSAVAAGGALLEAKYAADGVTLAVACDPPRLDWSW